MPLTQVPKDLIKSINLTQIESGGATNGQVLTYNGTAGSWTAATPVSASNAGINPSQLANFIQKPVGPTNGQVLTYNSSTNSWTAVTPITASSVDPSQLTRFIEKPAIANSGQVLTYNGSTWLAATPTGGSARLPAGTAGQILRYNGTEWTASDNLDMIPIGTVHWFSATQPPIGYLECNGAIISQTAYSDLYQVIGTRYNRGGEGTGSFRLPDLRGEFIRGWDNGRGVDTGRTLGSNQDDMFESHAHQQTGNFISTSDPLDYYVNFVGNENPPNVNRNNGSAGGVTISNTGGTETRPRNVALLPCIKALRTTTATIQSLNFIERPSQSADGQVLTYQGSTGRWIAGNAPIGTGGGSASTLVPNFLTGNGSNTYNLTNYVDGTPTNYLVFISGVAQRPGIDFIISNRDIVFTNTVATGVKILVYAIAGSVTSTINQYATVGDAKVGIFASAVCFIPSNPGTGLWTAPAGCYSARVTVVGGGSVNMPETTCLGGRSHFNYPNGVTTGANQLFANGAIRSSGGNAGWNGNNILAVGGYNAAGSYQNYNNCGDGGGGNGGYGGGGGTGSFSQNGGGGASYGGHGQDGGFGSGGVNGKGSDTSTTGGGALPLSYAATSLPNFTTALAQRVGYGSVGIFNYGGGGGGGWCTAIVSVIPGQIYSYGVGAGGFRYSSINAFASHGMVVIEW